MKIAPSRKFHASADSEGYWQGTDLIAGKEDKWGDWHRSWRSEDSTYRDANGANKTTWMWIFVCIRNIPRYVRFNDMWQHSHKITLRATVGTPLLRVFQYLKAQTRHSEGRRFSDGQRKCRQQGLTLSSRIYLLMENSADKAVCFEQIPRTQRKRRIFARIEQAMNYWETRWPNIFQRTIRSQKEITKTFLKAINSSNSGESRAKKKRDRFRLTLQNAAELAIDPRAGQSPTVLETLLFRSASPH